ncbi:MAG: Acetyltransferase, GNAT family protein [uncultured bacterium]|nr:MAG: Acetyltransferase, GNAT family protein [uncultured bacterium]OGT24838.1 MAG: hypothetical protein A2W47_07650 [Gammaproteobacteria bacterium RIFCSPHIGHO2_12_38_15]OGT75381.1 MAG: hypothetical protein A3G71_02930 [Gammaproteobacteria bacterium RIFCSPLOWO2_12_FULL_38_14]
MANNLKIEKVKNKKELRLRRLLQLYQHDWSEITGEGHISNKGLYTHINLNKFWKYPKSQAFIIKVSGEIAGFVMIKKHSYLINEKPSMVIDEFFVLRNFRKQKIGTEAAMRIFNLFPGRWQVAEMHVNKRAQKFWNKIISIYTGNNYKETIENSKLWRGPVQIFNS